MLLKKIRLIFVLFICSCCSLYAQVETSTKTAISELYSLISKNSEMTSDFSQIVISPNGTQNLSKGSLSLKKPNLFRWEVDSPAQIIVSNGYKLWSYNKDLEQVIVQPVPKKVDNAPYLLLLAGHKDVLQSNFFVKKIKNTVFELSPKKADSMIKNIRIIFIKGKLVSLRIQTLMDQINIFTFNNQSYKELPSSLFNLSIPKGVDILGQ